MELFYKRLPRQQPERPKHQPNNPLRRVEYYELGPYNLHLKTVSKFLVGEALFHAFGVDYDQYDEGPGAYSTAIIELEDGSVENIRADLIKFIDK